MTTTAFPRYASPVDFDAYGQYGAGRGFDSGQAFKRPRYPFRGRITADGSSGYRAEPGRYHLYISWGCPWAQRTAIVRKLMGLAEVVSLSYVDDERDGRAWAFRASRDGTAGVPGGAVVDEPLPVRRGGDRVGRAAVADAGQVRPRVQPARQDQRTAACRLPGALGLRPRPLPAARLQGDHGVLLVR